MFAQNSSEMLEYCTRVTHDVIISYGWKHKAFKGWGGYTTAIIENLLGNAVRIESLNEKISNNETTEVYKNFYQGRLSNILLNVTPPADELLDDYQPGSTLMSARKLASIFGSNPFFGASEEPPFSVNGDMVV